MRKLILAFISLFCIGANAQELNDGPYVLYCGDTVVLNSVVRGTAIRNGYPLTKKGELEVPVRFAAHPEWDFKVKLRQDMLTEPSEFAQPEKLFFISDVEGEFEGFRKLLISSKIIDEHYNWTFGKGHMVICGDLFDRGSNVPESIWLIYKLEQSAKAAGGYLHTILGNHDIMNLSGDLRYLQPKYLESAKLMGLDYMSLFTVNTELGRWLRTKNTIEKIGDNLCAHAGIAPQINELGLSLQQINALSRPYYDKASAEIKAAGESVSMFFSGNSSPFWYRGYFMEPKATEAEVDETLKLYGVKRIVVGHTIVAGNVNFYYGTKVMGIDVNHHVHDHQAALYETGKWYKVNDKGERTELKASGR
ncbi:metallophosphoesterase [Pedobacter sp. GR22-6]|uniref:metallophosphoesterase n=1 Tax=Pedobacter sp. GR22-6 TaxID=3127957 RepID=UPI00307ED88D